MSWNGFLPKGVKCKQCGAVLEGEGEGRPAESYLGTYNGLCYPCTGKSPYFTGEVLLSGAHVYSHPPSCPSHRRDRETYYFFEDCKDCQFGCVRKYSSGPFGGSYNAQCEKCSKRHYGHPTIVAQTVAREKRGWKLRVFGAMAEKKLIASGVPFWSRFILTKSYKTVDQFNALEKATFDLQAGECTKLAKDMDDSLSFPEGYPLLTKAEYARLFRKDGQFMRDLPPEYVADLEKVAVKQRRKKSGS
jgi:hypothetical protein